MLEVKQCVTPSPEQWEIVIKGMRNAFKSWDKNDSTFCEGESYGYCGISNCPFWSMGNDGRDARCGKPKMEIGRITLGENDKKLLLNLTKLGTSDRKLLRQLPIIMEITAPSFWWRQFDTYKVGTTANSTSQMHTMLKDKFKISDFSFEGIPGYRKIITQEFPEFSKEELSKEEWVDLGNGYTVSNLGRMTGIKTDILKPVITKHGYCSVYMRGKIYKLHRVVADVFCPKKPEANVVNHINGNKLDNRAENLEWVTQKENIEHSRKNHLQGFAEKMYKGKFTEDQRQEIIDEYNTGNYSMRQLAKNYNVSHTCIREMVRGVHTYQDKENYFELYCIPIIEKLNELRDQYLVEKDEKKKKLIWFAILKYIPQSFNYSRTVSLNYEVALQIIHQRKTHELTEWHQLIDYMLDNIPYLKELYEASCYQENTLKKLKAENKELRAELKELKGEDNE